MSDVVNKLWGFCNVLRHDGVNYGDYIEQLTYLLFLKLADEKAVYIPEGYGWSNLKKLSGRELTHHYAETLRTLSGEDGILGDIFQGSRSKFRRAFNLKTLIDLIDGFEWSAFDVDIKAKAYEGLLEKYAAEQKGAGQYFTPREAIRSVVRCIRPEIRERPDFTIHDPAVGTGGFLIAAYEWNLALEGGAELDKDTRTRLQKHTLSGVEIDWETRRLALMNLYLHGIEADIYYGDSLAQGPHAQRRYDCVMTNPPFGVRGGGGDPARRDFRIRTSNKQLNFLQHVMTILKPRGRAAIVLPDNVLFEGHAGREVRRMLLEDCDLHTILRLPIGTFTPYSPGVRANILFFRKGIPTEKVWIYDLRTNIDKVTKTHPLTADYFRDFEACFNAKPRTETERFRCYTIDRIVKELDCNLDISWLEDKALVNSSLAEPEDLISEIVTSLAKALDAVNELALEMQSDAEY